MTRGETQDGDIPWTQYLNKEPRTRNSSLASIASFASAASISSIASKVSNFWRPNVHEQARRTSVVVPTEPKYVHVPQHAAADHFKTTASPAVRKASIASAAPPPPPGYSIGMGPAVPVSRSLQRVPEAGVPRLP